MFIWVAVKINVWMDNKLIVATDLRGLLRPHNPKLRAEYMTMQQTNVLTANSLDIERPMLDPSMRHKNPDYPGPSQSKLIVLLVLDE